MKVKLDGGAFLPERAHDTDAGLDLRSPRPYTVPAHGHCIIPTGVHVQLPHGTAGLIVSKSGLNIRDGITSRGLIDEGYTGEIVVRLDNAGDADKVIQRGDKISQLVIVQVLYDLCEQADALEASERGENGFGSTGR